MNIEPVTNVPIVGVGVVVVIVRGEVSVKVRTAVDGAVGLVESGVIVII